MAVMDPNAIDSFELALTNMLSHFTEQYLTICGEVVAKKNPDFVQLQHLSQSMMLKSTILPTAQTENEARNLVSSPNENNQQNIIIDALMPVDEIPAVKKKRHNPFINYVKIPCQFCPKKLLECYMPRHLRMMHNIDCTKYSNFNQDDGVINSNPNNNDLSRSESTVLEIVNQMGISDLISSNASVISTNQANVYGKRGRKPKNRFQKYKSVTCHICSKNILEIFLARHLRKHQNQFSNSSSAEVSPVSCTVCGEMLKKSRLKGHMILRHGYQGLPNKAVTSSNLHSPSTVDQNSFLHNNTNGSSIVSDNQLPVNLPIMNSTTYLSNETVNANDTLPKMNIRNNDRIVRCYLCLKEKTTFTIERHFRKNHCGGSAVNLGTSDNNLVHSEEETAEFEAPANTVACSVCGEYVYRSKINAHMQDVHNGAGFCFRCSACNAKFVRQHGCRVHISHMHKNQGAEPLLI